MTSLQISRTMQLAEPQIRSILESYGPSGMSILTKAQMDGSMKIIHQWQQKQKLQQQHPDVTASNNKHQTTNTQEQRTAAVLIPICAVNSIPSVLFTLRSSKVTTHKSEISFPGGHTDHTERLVESPEETALRETQEELSGIYYDEDGANNDENVKLYDYTDGINILGTLQCVPSLRGMPVTPVIGTLTYDLSCDDPKNLHHIFPGNKDEVERVFAMSVEELIQVETAEPLPRLGKGALGPVFPVTETKNDDEEEEDVVIGKIWGLTAIILRPVLKNILRPVFLDGKIDTRISAIRNAAL